MARETTQDKRSQAKTRSNQPAQRNARDDESTRKGASDRQTPIQTDRDEGRGSASSSVQRSGSREQTAQGQQNQQAVARRGVSAPVRGGADNPFTLMQRVSEDMDRLFEQFGFGRLGLGLGPSWGSLAGSDVADRSQSFGGLQNLWAPQIETIQRGDRLVVRADLPGVNKDDVHVEVDNGVLTISGERRNERNEEREGFYRSERSYGQFFRAIPLPDGAKADECDAKFNDGVLEVSLPLPKQEERSAKRIQIR